MKKVIVLGSLGMAGHIMTEYLNETGAYEVVGVARQEARYVDKVLDVTNFVELEELLEVEKSQFVINCVGALVPHSTENVSSAILLNSYLPQFLSELGRKLHYKLIHISTDCVFSGKEGEYTETSFKDGDDNYARSKSLGEVTNNQDLTIRTSIIGPELKQNGTSLLDWFFKQRSEVSGYSKAYWSGVTTLELAKATHAMMIQEVTGLYQLCPESKISKFKLLEMISEVWGKQVRVNPSDSYSVDKSLVCTRTDFNYTKPDYLVMLTEMKHWMEMHAADYTHYKKVY